MAKDGALADACRTLSRDVAKPPALAPATGVLSIADAAGAAAGQGRSSLPSGSATGTVPGPVPLPAIPGPRTLPGSASGAVPGALPLPSNAKILPDAKTLSAPTQAVTAPVHNAVADATAIAEPRRLPTGSAADAKTLFPARSAVPLLAASPDRPANANACTPQQALRTAPADRQAPAKKERRHPKPEHGEAARGSGQNPGAQKAGAQKAGAQKPEARNQGTQGALTPQGESRSTSSQSGASGQEQSTQTFPAKERRHRKSHHPRKQPGVVPPAQTAPQNAGRQAAQTAQAGPQGERKKAAKDKRQRHDGTRVRETEGTRARGADMGVRPDVADGRHVPRLQPREYPKAASQHPIGDITAPAALTKVTGANAVTDLATATGKKLLP